VNPAVGTTARRLRLGVAASRVPILSVVAHSLQRMPSPSPSPAPVASVGRTACDARAVGARLRELRLAAGLTQAGLAARLGSTQSAVARLEAGGQRLSLAALRRVAAELGSSVELVISGPGER